MKNSFVFVIVLLTVIIIMSSFGLYLDNVTPIQLPKSVEGRVLFVCPMAHSFWDSISHGLAPYFKYISMGLLFCGIVLLFFWGWALYQNLIKDEFKKEAFVNPWAFTKILIWAVVLATMLVHGPNRYREVKIDNAQGNWVLCEADSSGAKPVSADAVHAK